MSQKPAAIRNAIAAALLQQRAEAREKDADDPRGVYFRDATAILHSTPFRRLRHKTQVFFAPANDHICTRLEHVLHVASIAVTICRALELDTDLAWAIGIGHDLGHAPFGHLGETVIEKLTRKRFCHELHSLRVVDIINPLNLSYAVRDGMVTHCGEKFEQSITPAGRVQDISSFTDREAYPATYEGCIIRMADKIAYLGRDYEDAVRLGITDHDSLPLPVKRALGSDTNSDSINAFTRDLIAATQQRGTVGFSDEMFEAMNIFKNFNYATIYKSDFLNKQAEQFEKLLSILYAHLEKTIAALKDDAAAYESTGYPMDAVLGRFLADHGHLYNLRSGADQTQALIDFIVGMTDDFIISGVRALLFPKWDGTKL